MAELIDLNEIDQQKALVLMLNQLQLISVQLYRLYDLLAVTALQNTPGTPKETRYFNTELKGLLDYHEAGNMPFAAEIDLLGEPDGQEEEGESDN